MSSQQQHHKIKKVSNVERRTWDLEAYEKRAQLRQQQQQQEQQQQEAPARAQSRHSRSDHPPNDTADTTNHDNTDHDDDKEEFRPAPRGALGPEGSDRAFLQARQRPVADLDSRIGQTEFVSMQAATAGSKNQNNDSTDLKAGVIKTGVGWHCKVCDCFLKDSHTYLDHINGRKHQRKLGYSMQVQRSTQDDLQSTLQALQAKKQQEQQAQSLEQVEDFHDMVQAKDEALRRKRDERRQRRKQRKAAAAAAAGHVDPKDNPQTTPSSSQSTKEIVAEPPVTTNSNNNNTPAVEKEEEEEEPTAAVDPNLAALMGFSGFGG